jgi:hypothetical protein
MQMNIVRRAILRACWQAENERGMQEARPWLCWLMTRVVGMRVVPPRESERSRVSKEQWCAVRREEGLKIDAETAQVCCKYGSVLDPYGLYDLTYEEDCIARNYFARTPGSDVWVEFDDLPDAVRYRLWARIRAGDFDDDESLPFDDTNAGPAPAEKVTNGSE